MKFINKNKILDAKICKETVNINKILCTNKYNKVMKIVNINNILCTKNATQVHQSLISLKKFKNLG